MKIKLPIIYKRLRDGGYYAFCPDLKGVRTTAETFETASANIRALILLALEELYMYEKEDLADAKTVFAEVADFDVT